MITFLELQNTLNDLFNVSKLTPASLKTWLSNFLENSRGTILYNDITTISDISKIATTSMDIGTEIKVFIQKQSLTFKLINTKTTVSIEPFFIVPDDYNADTNAKNWQCITKVIKWRTILTESDVLSLKDNAELTLINAAPTNRAYIINYAVIISLADYDAYIIPDGTIELDCGNSKNADLQEEYFTTTTHLIDKVNVGTAQKEKKICLKRSSSNAITVDGTQGSTISIDLYLSLTNC